MLKYKVADIIFETNHIYNYTPILCKNYLYNGEEKAQVRFTITQKDLDFEREKSAGDIAIGNHHLESLALYRKLCDYALNNANGIMLHCSAVAVDNKGYLFTAPSGTGKSTHAKLWCQTFGDKVVYINDDKPIIRYIKGEFIVYGTPWSGKHRLDNDISAKVKAICLISQAKENSIKKVAPSEILLNVLNQTVRPEKECGMDKLLTILDKLLQSVDLYKLSCNVSTEAAQLSFLTMTK